MCVHLVRVKTVNVCNFLQDLGSNYDIFLTGASLRVPRPDQESGKKVA